MRWLGLALLGILVAAAISIAASRLASQQIGLASQPIQAGDALAPASAATPPRQHRPRRRPAQPLPPRAPEPLPPEPRGEPPPSPEPPPSTTNQAPEPAPGGTPSGAGDGETGGADD